MHGRRYVQDRDTYRKECDRRLNVGSNSDFDIHRVINRIEELENQINRIELRLDFSDSNILPSEHPSGLVMEQNIIKERLLKLESNFDLNQPAVSFPVLGLVELAARLDDVERNCSRMVADSFAAVETVHMRLESLETNLKNAVSRMDGSVSTIASVVSKLLEAKKLHSHQ